MNNAIPLLNLQQEHLGFMLIAGIPETYPVSVGEWEGDCIFMGPPMEARLFDDPGFIVISEHRAYGEHRVTITNDGTMVCFKARSSIGAVIYLSIPLKGLGDWGIDNGSSQTKLGHTLSVQD